MERIKVLVIHNYHRKGSASGDDQVYKLETALLEERGNQVIRYTVSNDDFDKASLFKKIQATFGMVWSRRNYKSVHELIAAENPDLVHVHTFFPLLSPSILYAAKRRGVPVLATLHDTRFACPCATSLRGLSLCNECGDGHYWRMCKYRCFKGSRIQSLIVAAVFKYHRLRKTFYNQIDKYICLNDSQIELLVDIGFDRRKIVKKYNFVLDVTEGMESAALSNLPPRYVVFYGRMGEEKGVRVLMEAWTNIGIPLVVMGSGPMEHEVQAWARSSSDVIYLGYTEHDKCMRIVRDAAFVVFPSIWYEGCSMVEIEAMSLGKGLIATDIGFSHEAIVDGYNGYKFALGDVEHFKEETKHLWNNHDECLRLGANARKEYEHKYAPNTNYAQLYQIYKSLLVIGD